MAPVQEIKVPLLAVNDTSLTVVDIPFTHGAAVKKGDVVVVFESSKTTYDVVAETDGYISYICETGEDYDVNAVIANIYNTPEELPTIKQEQQQKVMPLAVKEHLAEAIAVWEGDTMFSPAAVALMKTHNLAAETFSGRDFVSKSDIEQYLGITKKTAVKKEKAQTTALPTDADKVIVEKLSSNKKREIEYLGSVQQTGLTSTINTMVDTAGIFVHVNHSLQYLKNSLLPLIIYETARLLQQHRELNAYFAGDAIAYYKEVNIGFAIDIDKGLKVLRVPEAGDKSIQQIEADIMLLSNHYLDDSLTIDDLTGISFTITDLSSEGVSSFRPLVNMMNSAILGVSSIDEKLQRCMLSVTFDHRVTEGKPVARFLQELKERLESYRSGYGAHANSSISCFKCFKMLKDDVSDVGFTRCVTPKGEEAYICQSCLKGF